MADCISLMSGSLGSGGYGWLKMFNVVVHFPFVKLMVYLKEAGKNMSLYIIFFYIKNEIIQYYI